MGSIKSNQYLKSYIKQIKVRNKSQSFEICLEKCSECFLPCKLRRNHIKPEQLQKLNYLQSALSQLQSHIQAEENKIKSTLDIEKCQDQLQNYNQLYEKVQRKQIYLSQKTQLEIEIGIENFESEDSNTYIWQYFIGDNNDLNDNSLESINQKLAQNLDSAKQKYNDKDHQPLQQEDFNELNYTSLKEEYDNLIQLNDQIRNQDLQLRRNTKTIKKIWLIMSRNQISFNFLRTRNKKNNFMIQTSMIISKMQRTKNINQILKFLLIRIKNFCNLNQPKSNSNRIFKNLKLKNQTKRPNHNLLFKS
ncbi:hypothetical protein pb186bvf_009801 [Paramecium bursaria]